MYKDIDYEKMKEKVRHQGSLFQYRACSISKNTIYDLDNIMNGVLYARSPVHMNDPFDSTIAIDEKDIINKIIDLFIENQLIPDNVKAIMKILIHVKYFNMFEELIENLIFIKNKINVIILSRRLSHKKSLYLLYQQHNKLISEFINRGGKRNFTENEIKIILLLLDIVGDNEITEDNLIKIQNFNEMYNELEIRLRYFRENSFQAIIRTFQRNITVSCLSASGWHNHLMWSHYTNSYKGICVEYDFSNLQNDIGIIDEVTYEKERTKLKLKDIYSGDLKLSLDSNGKYKYEYDNKKNTEINALYKCIFRKQDIWKYEMEWRIVNIENTENTERFIPIPKIKSITFGYNIDPRVKYMLIDICKQKNIDLYEIVPSTNEYNLNRKLVDIKSYLKTYEELIIYLDFLENDISDLMKEIIDNNRFSFENNNSNINNDDIITIYSYMKKVLKFITELYFYKSSFLILFKYYNKDELINIRNNFSNIDNIMNKILPMIEIITKNAYIFLNNLFMCNNFDNKLIEMTFYILNDIKSVIDKINKIS